VQEFTTFQDNQTRISFHIVQGQSAKASKCRSLGEFELSNLPALPAGSVRVMVRFSLDENGLLSVEAQGGTQTVCLKVNPAQDLSDEALLDLLHKTA
jgi:molecular chaperone HscA